MSKKSIKEIEDVLGRVLPNDITKCVWLLIKDSPKLESFKKYSHLCKDRNIIKEVKDDLLENTRSDSLKESVRRPGLKGRRTYPGLNVPASWNVGYGKEVR